MSDADDDLGQQVQALNARLDATNKRLDNLINLIIGDEASIAEERFSTCPAVCAQLKSVQDDIAELESSVANVAADVRTRADGGEQTKVERAERHARNELVRRAAVTDTDGIELAHLRATDVLEQQKPEQNMKYQTVKDAYENLRDRWEAIYIKDDPKRLVLVESGLSRELVLSVQEDLARDDLAKELISGKPSGGV